MNAQVKLAYARTRQRTRGQVISELQEAQANLAKAPRGTFLEEYAETRVARLKIELKRFPTD